MDYNVEIPFKRPVPEGRFEAGPDEEPKPNPFKSAVSLQQIEGKRRDEELKRRKGIDQKRMKKLKEKDMPKALNIINRMSEAGIVHKKELVLPEPQVSDAELKSISKMSQTGAGSSDRSTATQVLIGNYTQKEPTPMVMRTPMIEDSVLREAQNALAIKESQTPLLGGVSAQVKTPQVPEQSSVPRTPNTLLRGQRDTIFRPPTNRSGKIPNRPTDSGVLRDQLKINVDEVDKAWEQSKAEAAGAETVPAKSVSELLKSLPAPQNEYNIEAPNVPEPEPEPEIKEVQEDMEEVEARVAKENGDEDEAEAKKVSLPVRRNLPRPFVALRPITAFGDPSASELIDEEIEKLVTYDNFMYPGKFIKQPMQKPEMEEYSRDELLAAKELITEEVAKSDAVLSEDDIAQKWEEVIGKLTYFPGTKSYDTVEGKSTAELVEAKTKNLEKHGAHFDKLRKDIAKIETKIEDSLSGYIKEEAEIKEKTAAIADKTDQDRLKKAVFETLKAQEERAMRLREAELQKFLRTAEETEDVLQKRYKELSEQKAKLRKDVADVFINITQH